MGRVIKVLLLLALVVPVTAYVAATLSSPGPAAPVDHSPVILRDAPATPTQESPSPDRAPREPDRQQDKARVVTPLPTPVGENDDDEWDDDGPDDDDDTDDERDD